MPHSNCLQYPDLDIQVQWLVLIANTALEAVCSHVCFGAKCIDSRCWLGYVPPHHSPLPLVMLSGEVGIPCGRQPA